MLLPTGSAETEAVGLKCGPEPGATAGTGARTTTGGGRSPGLAGLASVRERWLRCRPPGQPQPQPQPRAGPGRLHVSAGGRGAQAKARRRCAKPAGQSRARRSPLACTDSAWLACPDCLLRDGQLLHKKGVDDLRS